MMNKSKILRFLTVNFALAGFVLISGYSAEISAQTRDPFSKPGWARTRDVRTGSGVKKAASPISNLGAPAIEQRIEYYKRLREAAAVNGRPLPKVTSVLTISEMAVMGIFRTPRGYAAMVEATPIKLSYTIYPGDKFFDGQLVAVEENRLVFRKVTKMSNGKFVATVENKPLRKYSDIEQIRGTAPAEPIGDSKSGETVTATAQVPATDKPAGPIVSPLEEMNRQVPAAEPAKPNKKVRKTVKVAKSKNN